MGEGFVVTQASDCKVTYYQDEPGSFLHSTVANAKALNGSWHKFARVTSVRNV